MTAVQLTPKHRHRAAFESSQKQRKKCPNCIVSLYRCAMKSEISLGSDRDTLRRAFLEKLVLNQAKLPGDATRNDKYLAIAAVVRDRILDRWTRSTQTFVETQTRTVIYLSAEFLLGPQLGSNILNLGLETEIRAALTDLGISLDELRDQEEEPGLGNGGLGRLAACFMDSLATLNIPAIGHGIRYEFGIFDQEIVDGAQVERTDRWLRFGNPWEIRRYEIEHEIAFGGHTEHATDAAGVLRVRWLPARVIKGVPYDTPMLGYATNNANFLRLWSAVASEEFNLDAFQHGDYLRAVEEKVRSENISKVLYPNDESIAGKELRLSQQYFFVSCALQDCIRLLLQQSSIENFAERFAVQLNDTHPTLGIPELMRLFVDVHGLSWDDAWKITSRTFSYTNHTLLPEALEVWPMPIFERLLPRHAEIILEINRRFLEQVRTRYPGDETRVARMSLIDERGPRYVRMAHLATVASHKVNGVAALHSRLLRETVLADFANMYPERFLNVTNGVTPRRFVALANPRLADLLDETIGKGWLSDSLRLERLRPFAEDAAFREKFLAIKKRNKGALSRWLDQTHATSFNPDAMLDAQCKRIHEYKRQHLAMLHAVYLMRRITRGDTAGITPRTMLFAGKAAPGYRMAKILIRLIHHVAKELRSTPKAEKLLQIVFVPDFNVKNAERIYPAVDLSEQISTAGYEASGTGNMKFALNGALTVGTLDGANVEIRDAVGAENFFLFGLTAAEVATRKREGYRPRDVVAQDPELAEIMTWLQTAGGRNELGDNFAPLAHQLLEHDPFLVLADFRAYVEAQERVSALWATPDSWTRKAILNVASMGSFSSDRSIAEYAKNVWRTRAVVVK
jgi:glycogen phosphorylase